jgi:hypothetical protein
MLINRDIYFYQIIKELVNPSFKNGRYNVNLNLIEFSELEEFRDKQLPLLDIINIWLPNLCAAL